METKWTKQLLKETRCSHLVWGGADGGGERLK